MINCTGQMATDIGKCKLDLHSPVYTKNNLDR